MASSPSDLTARLKAFEGQVLGGPLRAQDAVNPAMIRHWCEAMGDDNPVYTDADFAAKSPWGGLVAPPTMLQAWTMPGLKRAREARPGAFGGVMQLLDEAGFTSVVATNCEQEYERYLTLGDHLQHELTLESVSDEKQTALGTGHFVTMLYTYTDQAGEVVGRMRMRLLKFRPPEKPAGAAASAARRPRPGRTLDTAFFWEAAAEGRLVIQRCTGCQALRHPPEPMCPACHSLDWDTIEASGRGVVYSMVVPHHPKIPAFPEPHVVALVELEEGTRLVSNVIGIEPTEAWIGMPVQVDFVKVDDELVLPQFRPAAGATPV